MYWGLPHPQNLFVVLCLFCNFVNQALAAPRWGTAWRNHRQSEWTKQTEQLELGHSLHAKIQLCAVIAVRTYVGHMKVVWNMHYVSHR